MSPGWPYWKVRSGAPGALLFFRSQVAVLGRHTPMVVTPSPSQSPTTGIELGLPNWNGARAAPPGVLRSFQVAGGSPTWADPSKTPIMVGATPAAVGPAAPPDPVVESAAGDWVTVSGTD